MFWLKSLFAKSKPIQYSSYVIVLALIVASKLYSTANTTAETKRTNALPLDLIEKKPSVVTRVDKVIDGDTIIAGGTRYRLALIDAPEQEQAYGLEATAFLRGLVADTEITITEHGQDHYGRIIGEASINGISIAEIMIENGFAWPYMVSTAEAENKLLQLQNKAKEAGLGLWNDPDPIPPSLYRQIKHAANY